MQTLKPVLRQVRQSETLPDNGEHSCSLASNSATRTLHDMRRLVHRPRRLRRSAALRNLVRETHLNIHDFVLPLFVSGKLDERRPVASMPGVFQVPVKGVADEARRAQDVGLEASTKTRKPAAPTRKTESFKRGCERSNQNVPS